MMIRLRYFAWLALSVFAAAGGASVAGAAELPNFVVILCDDLGYNDLGCYTYPGKNHPGPPPAPSPSTCSNLPPPNPAFAPDRPGHTLTPNLDRLAEGGLRFTSFYTSPVCSSSRASLMTGCYPARVGINGALMPTDPHGLNTTEVTLAALLKLQGYATICIGKWHLGKDPQFLPTRRGFDEYFGLPYSNDMLPLSLYEGEKPVEEIAHDPLKQCELTRRYTSRALEFIEKNRNQPFFLYLAQSMPHVPVYPSTNFAGLSGKGDYYDVVMELDWSAGQIISKLRQLGLDKNTLVLFTSDNGPWHSRPDPNTTNRAVGSAYPLRGSKHTVWDGGVRVPCLMSWPGHIAPGTVTDQLAGLIDILPTFTRLAGGALPQDRVLDGIDLAPLLFGPTQASWAGTNRFFFDGEGRLGAVRSGAWKLFENSGKTNLANLDTDIQESTDLRQAQRDDYQRLRQLGLDFEAALRKSRRPPGTYSPQEIVLETNRVLVPAGGSASFRLKLAQAPTNTVQVRVDRFLGDTNFTVLQGATLSFSTNDWDRPQPVTVGAPAAAGTAESGAMFRCASSAFQPVRDVFVRSSAPPAKR